MKVCYGKSERELLRTGIKKYKYDGVLNIIVVWVKITWEYVWDKLKIISIYTYYI